MAWKEYCTGFRLKELQESMDTCTGRHYITKTPYNQTFQIYTGTNIFGHQSEPKYSTTCTPRPLKGNNESGLLQQVVFKCMFYYVDLRRVVVS